MHGHRDVSKREAYAHLLSLPGADTRLRLFAADLLGPQEQWATALHGCTALLHVAAAYRLDVASMERAARRRLVDTAVEGTRRVLQAAHEARSIRKVGR